MRIHRSSALVLVLVLGIVPGVAAPVAAGDDDGRHGPRIVPLRGEVDGRSAGELLGDVFVPNYAVPADQIPPCLRLGVHGDVLAPLPGETCDADEDTRVVLSLGFSCSDAEAPPFFAEGAAAQRRCARQAATTIVSMYASVDGGRAVRLDPGGRFRDTSRQVTVTAAEGNLAGAEPGLMRFVADGWQAEVTNLSPGVHTVTLDLVFSGGDTVHYEAVVVVAEDD